MDKQPAPTMKRATRLIHKKIQLGESLEARHVLSAIGFVHHELGPEGTNPQSLFAADFDGDGDVDIVFSSNDGVHWHENTDAAGGFGERRIIRDVGALFSYVSAADMDSDGDIDVLLSASNIYFELGGSSDARIAWYENTDGKGTFGPEQVIHAADDDGFGPGSVVDVDGDGDLDVIASSKNTIFWHENTNGMAAFGDAQVIDTREGWYQVSATDLDGDG